MKLKKKPSFCLFEGTDSVPKYLLAETLQSNRACRAFARPKFLLATFPKDLEFHNGKM
jgi:hypothetical protein